MLKKIIALILCVMMLGQICAFAAPFDDVDEESHGWAIDQIEEMTRNGIINGFEDGTFRPNEGVTRIDSLLLISRILGVDKEENEKTLDFAHDKYFQHVNLMKYPAYERNLSFILHRGMFTTEELTNFLKAGLGSQPLKRYEAAVLLVKMCGANDTVSKNDTVKLPFDDTEEIPAVARPFVYYCYQNGLMKGVGENNFDPMSTITRAQMSVLLYNCMKELNLSVISADVKEVSGFKNSITYVDGDGKEETFYNTGDTRITLNGEDIEDIDAILSGDLIYVHYSGSNVILIEAFSVLKDETVEGQYIGKGASSTFTKLMVKSNGVTKDYILDEDYRIYLADEPAKLSDLKINDYVKLTVKDSRVTIINIAERTKTITGYINSFNFSGQGSLEVKLSNNEFVTYDLNDEVKVTRNNEDVILRDLKVGDKVTIVLEYDKVTNVKATSTIKNYEGSIEEIIISRTNPRIKIDIGDEVIECAMDNSIEITINGEAADIYDVKLGYSAKIKTDSSTVTNIAITSTPVINNVNIMGTVLEVHPNYDAITVQVDEETVTQVFVKRTATIINGKTGKSMSLSAIKPGSIVTAVVTSSGFAAEAISVVVLEQ